MKFLLIQGANMEALGRRQPELYGTTTARELDALLRKQARKLGAGLDILYTNCEGEAVSAIWRAERAGIDGILFNPAGFLRAGHALRRLPEVHQGAGDRDPHDQHRKARPPLGHRFRQRSA